MKIGIIGHSGRVGKLLVEELSSGAWPSLELAGGFAQAGETAPYPLWHDMRDFFAQLDGVIDFSVPAIAVEAAKAAAQTGKPLVSGTTGLSASEIKSVEEAAKSAPILRSANMSVGVNLLFSFVERAAASLGPDWDIEIFESHHKNKVDAPSGTALALGDAAKAGRGAGDFRTDRVGKRASGEIGYAVSRGGDVVGEHTVTFYGMGERIELGHRATNRALFARGALTAMQWIKGKPPGLYSMKNVLSLD